MTDERRKYPRVPVFLDCEVDGTPVRGRMRLSDLSLGGCFVETTSVVKAETPVVIRVRLREHDVVLRGRSIHVQPGVGFGVALDFDDPRDPARQQLADFLGRLQHV